MPCLSTGVLRKVSVRDLAGERRGVPAIDRGISGNVLERAIPRLEKLLHQPARNPLLAIVAQSPEINKAVSDARGITDWEQSEYSADWMVLFYNSLPWLSSSMLSCPSVRA
jgi:hypothetical protein